MRYGVILAAALALAGCGTDAGGDGGVAGVETVREAAAEPDAWATEAELEWMRRLAGWSGRFAADGRRIAEFEGDPDRFDRVVAGEDAALDEYRDMLEPVRLCGESFAREVGEAPTERLRESARNFAQACRHFRRGIEMLLRALDAQDEGLAERAREEIGAAGKEAAIASGTLPPGEKQELAIEEGPSGGSRIDTRYSEAAGAVAGKEVEVRCWSPADWKRLMVEEEVFTAGRVDERVLGFASAGGKRISLAPPVCADLDALVYEERAPVEEEGKYALALALVTLAHEGVHASGVADEPTAECHGIQYARQAADRLGVDPDYAAELIGLYWDGYGRLPPTYRSEECREGGALDLDAGRAEFP